MKIPFISKLKNPACVSKQDVLELETLQYQKFTKIFQKYILYTMDTIIPLSIVLIGIASITDNPDWWPVTGSASNLDPAQPILDNEMAPVLYTVQSVVAYFKILIKL